MNCDCLTYLVFFSLFCFLFSFTLALMRDELNLDDLCGDVMKVNLHDDEDNSLASKNEAESGVRQKYASEAAF